MGSALSEGLKGTQAHRLQLSQTIRTPKLVTERTEVSEAGSVGEDMALRPQRPWRWSPQGDK